MAYKPMTEDPDAAMRDRRERLYWMTLLSGLANAALMALHLAGLNFLLTAWLIGGMAGSLIVAGIRGNTDGYYQSLVAVGMRWAMFALGVMLFLVWAVRDTGLFTRLMPWAVTLSQDGYLFALILGLAFHLGYAFAYLKDQVLFRRMS